MMYKNNFVAVVKCNGQILREKNGGGVYLPFGTEYSVLLKNKDARRALVNVEVDGKDVFKGSGLIMDGNQTYELKGFMRNMDETNRFKFIKKTKQIQRYRGDRIDDGLIRITYQFEKFSNKPITIRPSGDTFDSSNTWYRDSGFLDHVNRNVRYTSSFCSSDSVTFSVNQNVKSKAFFNAPLPEEGITVKGDKISERFQYGSIGDLGRTHTIVLQLKGRTMKKKRVNSPLTVKKSLRCDVCGRASKSSAKFCADCGNYLD